MTTTTTRPVPARPGHRSRVPLIAGATAAAVVAAVAAVVVVRFLHDDARRHYLGSGGWPVHGQAAYAIGAGPATVSAYERSVPIASVAKVMTALLVLRAGGAADLTVTRRDVDEYLRRRARDESTVRVEMGEHLTGRQALAALLLPSANNIAVMLARRVAGSVAAFVARMNAFARRLGMVHTHYTDPSGFDSSTRSTAGDQLVLAQRAMHDRVFARLVGLRSYDLPVVGTVRNTDFLLGRHGFVGIKTGSDDDAGGCFVFRTYRVVDGRRVAVTGVVLGQPGHDLVAAGQYAALQLAAHIAPES